MRHLVFAAFALSLASCLHVPPRPPAQDAGDADAGPVPEVPPRVIAVDVSDRHGTAYSPGAIPRSPIVRVSLSEAPLEEPPPVWIFVGAPDEDLADDLGDDPLRVATASRVVMSALEGSGTSWTLTPEVRLEPGGVVTLGVGGWMRGAITGLHMGAPFTEALTVSAAPEAGARVTASWPPDGAAAVPRALARLAVRFDGPVDGVPDGLALLEDAGERVAGVARPMPCDIAGWADGWCASFEPEHTLAAGSAYRLRVSEGLVDATGAPVGPWEARFTTAEGDDDPAPALVALACGLDELALEPGGCVLADDAHLVLRMQASEPVRVALSIAGRTLLDVAPRGSATLAADGLPPDTELTAVLRVIDLAEQVVEIPLSLRTTEPLPTIAVVEVRADPYGPEPRQEYVEVLNYGAVSVDLEGLSLSDRIDSMGDVVMRSQLVAPGQRALLVADDFDPEEPSDPPVPAAVPLVRMGRSLATGGISNAGEALFLRDAMMRRVSAAPALETGEGRCLARTGDDPRVGDPGSFVLVEPCTPGVEPAP